MVSQRGYDVKNCPDRFLVYSSAFQTLKIFNIYHVSTTIPAVDWNYIHIHHNLGYFAPYVVLYNGSTSIGTTATYFFSDSIGSTLVTKQTANTLTIEVSELFDSRDSHQGDTVYFTVFQFLDDFSPIEGRNINLGDAAFATGQDYGFRISKPGYDVKTCPDRDCVITSSAYTNIIHSRGKTTADQVAHNLGYAPAVFCYSGDETEIEWNNYASATETVIDFNFSYPTRYYIIFKHKNG